MSKLAAMFASIACLAMGIGGALAADSCEGRDRYTIYFATHAFQHPFFPILEAGAERGAADACLDFTWTDDDTFSVASTIERIEAAIAEQPDMLVISPVDPPAMRPTIERAVEAGIPMIAVNVPEAAPPDERLPYLIYIGGNEYEGGVEAAKQVLETRTPTKAVCVNSLPGHAGVETRCAGWAETMQAAGVDVSEVDVSGGVAQAEQAISTYLRDHPETDAFFTVTPAPDDYGVTLAALLEAGRGGGDAALVTFDLTPEVLASIKAGDTLAAIDQQPYLQGYLPAILARQYLDIGLMPGRDIFTGPSVVNADNIDQVLAGTKLGRR